MAAQTRISGCGAREILIATMLLCACTPPAGARAQDEKAALLAAEGPFVAPTDAAMTKMMRAMEIRPSGDADRDFVAMMVPHHQGAIEMAQALLVSGRNEQLRRLAQEIIVTQQQEIAAMRLALGYKLPPSTAAPTQPPPSVHPHTTAAKEAPP
jgi:hypothetical protein